MQCLVSIELYVGVVAVLEGTFAGQRTLPFNCDLFSAELLNEAIRIRIHDPLPCLQHQHYRCNFGQLTVDHPEALAINNQLPFDEPKNQRVLSWNMGRHVIQQDAYLLIDRLVHSTQLRQRMFQVI